MASTCPTSMLICHRCGDFYHPSDLYCFHVGNYCNVDGSELKKEKSLIANIDPTVNINCDYFQKNGMLVSN